MSKWKNNEIPIWVYGYPWYFTKPAYVLGTGFMGTGLGWTSPTHTVPVCHPTGAHAMKEAVWLHTLLSEFGELQDTPTMLLIDNQSTIVIAKNPTFHAHTKHIAIWPHFLQEKYASRELSLEYVPTGDQVADVLTKGLTQEKHKHFISGMGIHWRTC